MFGVAYLPPTTQNKINNNSDFNYQDGNISLKIGDSRYFIKSSPNVISRKTTFNNQITCNNYVGIFNSGINSYGNIIIYNGTTYTMGLSKTGSIMTC